MNKLTLFKEALLRFSEALAIDPKNPLVLDGSIQRFEFTFELCWKAIQDIVWRVEEVEVKTPRQAFEKAYALEWITDEKIWVNILKDRNLTSHTYDQKIAESIYSHLPAYQKAFESVLWVLEQQSYENK